jgi:Tol biopolymer transport system component
MPDVQEVFRMSTQKIRQDPGAMERQLDKRRRAARNRKLASFAVVGVIVVVAIVAAVAVRQESSEPAPSPAAVPSATGQTLAIVDVGSGIETPFVAPVGASGFDFTLDGSLVTYTDVDENGNDQVFVMDVDGSNQRQLTHDPLGVSVMETPPQWSPDASMIAYWVSLHAGDNELFVVSVSDGLSTRVTHEPTDVYEGGWASDRSFVYSISNPSAAYPLLARSIDLATGETTTIARDVSNPEASPDGTQIAFDSFFHPRGQIWLSLLNIDGTGRRKIVQVSNQGSNVKWSPDSTQIAYVDSTPDDGYGTFIYDLATHETRFVTAGAIDSWVDKDHILTG